MATQLSSWCHPPERLELKSDEVHVWSVRLAQPSSTLKSFLSLLSSDEERRADMLLSTRGNPQEASRWTLRELAPGLGYVAALAVEGRDWRLNCWQ